jgi:Nitronate monooxygenase/AraC-binding-like domain
MADHTEDAAADPWFRTTSPEQAIHLCGTAFDPHRLTLLGQSNGFGLTQRVASVGPVTIGDITYPTAVAVGFEETRGGYHVHVPLEGCTRNSPSARGHADSLAATTVRQVHPDWEINDVEPTEFSGSRRSGDRRADGGWTVNTRACGGGDKRGWSRLHRRGPSPGGCVRLQNAGITTVATVTTVLEAEMALARGAGALVAQGPSAGGHRATFDPVAQPACQPLAVLLAALSARVDAPIVAAGGLATSDDVNGVIGAGAVAAQLGTAFLLAHEAGTNPVHRGVLRDPNFTETVVTRAFTGRYARGLRNRFIDEHEAEAPFGFPEIGKLTGPLQAASSKGNDPHGMALWAGTAFRQAKAGSTAEIIAELT